MPQDIRIWEISPDNKLRSLAATKLDLEDRIEDWITQDISALADDLLVIGRQVLTQYGGFIDLLCIKENGDLVIVELKRHRTPRDVTAQALDYASWVKGLSASDIDAIAQSYLHQSLDEAFKKHFDADLPDSINQSHSLLIVASEIDSSSERIIRYLSETYGMDINAVTFNYFKSEPRGELLARTFLVNPSDVETAAARHGSKRTRLTEEQLQSIADEKGVGEIYRLLRQSLGGIFGSFGAFKTLGSFYCRMNDGLPKAVFRLVPGESSAERGLSFQAYTRRIAEYLGMNLKDLEELLPKNREPWGYYANAPEDLKGLAGFFKSIEDAHRFINGLPSKRSNLDS